MTLVVGGYFIYSSNENIRAKVEELINTKTSKQNSLVNPLSLARDQERRESVKAISDAIFQYTSENKGLSPKDFPTSETCIGSKSPCYNLAKLLVPIFIDKFPIDPKIGTQENTGFNTFKNSDGRIVVKVEGELGGRFEIVR